jgi:tetratricopeptide (TPR) repeat protein
MARLLPLLLALTACATEAPPGPEPVPVIAPELQALSAPEVRKTAAGWIERREEAGALERAVDLLAWHAHARPSAELSLLLAEAHARALDRLDLKREEDRPLHARHRAAGLRHSEAALRERPEDPAAQYWRACVVLHAAEAESSYARLNDAVKLLEAAEAEAPDLDHGGPARMLGRIYQETPGWPMLGSKAKAAFYYKRSIERAPDFAQTHLWLGETYVSAKRQDLARPFLEKAATLPLRPGHEEEDGRHRAAARRLLEGPGP